MVGILTATLRRIARVAKAANEMLALIVKEHAITEIDAPLFSHACSNAGIGLSFINAIPILPDDVQAMASIMVRIFWHSIRVQPIIDHEKERGTTWLEFFAFFALNGGTAVIHTRAKEHLRVKFIEEFIAFKSISRGLFRYASDDSSSLLQPMLRRAINHMQPFTK